MVQIDPTHDPRFGGCFMLVEEVKSWGVQGFVKLPAQGDAYYRVPFEHCMRIGTAEWVPEDIARAR